jgi:hypothetical protein
MNTTWAKLTCPSLFDEDRTDPTSAGRRWCSSGLAAPRQSRLWSAVPSALITLLAITVVALSPQRAAAQGLPTTIKGDVGLKSGSQPPPGLYITNLVFNYNFDTLRTNDGDKIEGSTSIN